MQKQKTLATSFSMQGKGLHTGLDIQITFHPAPENHGYKIKRVDLEGEPVIEPGPREEPYFPKTESK